MQINNKNIDMVKLLLKHRIYVTRSDVERAKEIGVMEIHKLLDRRYRSPITRVRKMFDPFNESVKDLMVGKSEEEIERSMDSMTPDELNDILVRSITKYDLESLEMVLPYVDIDYQGQEYELCESVHRLRTFKST